MDEALVPHAQRLRIGRSNFRLLSDIKSKESTLQLVYDVLRRGPFFKAFLITADVPEIYMQEFWATTIVHHHAIRFKMDNKKHIVNLESFRDMLNICPRVPGQSFDEPPFEEEILAFIHFLRHSAAIGTLTDVNINKLYQPWRSFAAIISKCLTGKSSGYDSLRLSLAQILWGLYHKRNVDYAYLMRNKVNWHYVRDDHMFSIIKLVSKHQNTQQFGALLPIELTNDEIRKSKAYKGYYAVATGEAAPKPKASVRRTRSSSDTSITPPTTDASPRLTASTHISQPSGSGADKGTGSKPGVSDVPTDESEEELSWNSTYDEGDDNEEKDDDGMESIFETTLQLDLQTPTSVAPLPTNLYKALVEAYESDKIILDTYGETVTLRRRRDDDADKDEKPSARPDRGSKRRREEKEPESASASLETATRSAGRSTKGSRSRHALVSESDLAEEPVQTTFQMDEPSHPEFDTGANDHPILQSSRHPEWFSQQQIPPTLDRDWNKTLPAVQGSIQPWISELAKQVDSRSSFKELMDTPLDFSKFLINRLKVDTLTPKLLAGPTYEMMKGSCKEACGRPSTGCRKLPEKLNLTKPDTYRSDLKRKEAYTAYSNPRGFIYQNKDKKNRLMRIDELHKFSDETLTDVRTVLDDRLKGIRMQYLPHTIWRNSDKDRAAAMIQAIDKRLKTRRIMRSLERFVGGRLYGRNFRMLQRTI
nr:hypothetical protein [Tanacetum cinerariifolium]